jgi:hypothetical protein
MFNCTIKSILLYGGETWKVDKETTHKLQTFLNKSQRKIHTKDTLARQNKQHRIVEQNKSRTSRNHSKRKEMELDSTYVKKGKRQRCKTSTRTLTGRKKGKPVNS